MMSLRSARGVKSGVDDEMIMLCIARDPIENVSYRNLERERRNSENISTTTLCGALRKALLTHIHVRCEFLADISFFSLSFDSFFSISASQAPPVPAPTVAVDSSAQQFSPLNTVRRAHTRLACERASKLLSTDAAMLTIGLEKLVFLRNSSPWLGATHRAKRAAQQGWNEIGKKKKESYLFNKTMIFHRGSS